MIQSMTGFGRYELCEGTKKYTAEIKTVNHRYFDLSIKMPKKFNQFESEIRNLLKKYIQRGKVDLYLTFEDASKTDYSLQYNEKIACQYVEVIARMSEEFSLQNDLTATMLSRYPEIITMEEEQLDEEETLSQIKKVLEIAAQNLVAARNAEGENLKRDLLEKLDLLDCEVSYIESRSPEIVEDYKKRLEEQVSGLLNESGIDQNRILAEVTIFADKACVDEEIVRLHSHIESVRKALSENTAIGRKLDFIVQELNREANTILSKANHIDISEHGVILKTEIEKIREQIQNIE